MAAMSDKAMVVTPSYLLAGLQPFIRNAGSVEGAGAGGKWHHSVNADATALARVDWGWGSRPAQHKRQQKCSLADVRKLQRTLAASQA